MAVYIPSFRRGRRSLFSKFTFEAILLRIMEIAIFITESFHARIGRNIFNSSERLHKLKRCVEGVSGATQDTNVLYGGRGCHGAYEYLHGRHHENMSCNPDASSPNFNYINGAIYMASFCNAFIPIVSEGP